jgi:DnaK suppressor protein
MKTVAKKAVKKVPVKAGAKAVTKVAAKKTVQIAKPTPKAAAKSVVKAAAKPVTKVSAKTVKKPVVKAVVKAVVKTLVKPATKVVAKKIVKPAAKPLAKTTKSIQQAVVQSKKVVKKAEHVPVEIKTAKAVKEAKPAKTLEKTKAAPKLSKEEPNLKQPMVIASKIASPEIKDLTPVAPALSKARTSRLASLTVPSMAQSVASTAAKSSYGPHVPSLAIIPPPQFAPKQNPKLANNWKTKSAEEMNDEELLAMPDSEYMNIKQMMYFRLKLLQLKQGILASAGATTEHLRDESAVVPDPTDRATIEEEHALELRTRDRERKLLKKIEQSIVRIDAGDYGYCDETGEAIGVGRLLARPTATLSLEAQQRRELKQKMFGD